MIFRLQKGVKILNLDTWTEATVKREYRFEKIRN